MTIVCKLCGKRRARRYCPGVSADICPVCCGTERENTIDCPLDCEHLQVARVREKPAPLSPSDVPNQDVRLTEEFLEKHEELIVWLALALQRAMEQERAVDLDSKEALDALIRTYRTLESGLIYETKPQNPFAASIQTVMRESVEEFRKLQAREAGMQTLRDTDVLGVLVFLQRMELQHDNGRRRGRAFFDFLRSSFPNPPAAASVEL